MFELPNVKKSYRGWKKYVKFLDLRFTRIQEEHHFQSYYFHIYVKQIRIAIAFLTAVLLLALIVDYISPLEIDKLPALFPFSYINETINNNNNNQPSNPPPSPSQPPIIDDESLRSMIIRVSIVGCLSVFFIYTFTDNFKRLWKFYSCVMSFIATCIPLIFVSDFRTIPERMIFLYIAISIASGLTFLPAAISSFGLSIFYFLYFFLYNEIYYKSILLVSTLLFVSLLFLMSISRYREQLIRAKFRILESSKLQTMRSAKVINQMLPTVVVQRLRLQSSKEQSLSSIVSETTRSTLPSASSETSRSEGIPSSPSSFAIDISSSSTTASESESIHTPTISRKHQAMPIDPQSPSSLQPGQYSGDELIVDKYEQVTVLFCEIVNFVALVDKMSSKVVITLLNEIYNSFDRMTDLYGVTKVEHIGNVYMVVGGCPESCPDHAQRVANMSLGMLSIVQRFEVVQVRFGMHTGPVIGGIIGKKKLSWHLFGDTINTASRMASHGSIGKIQCSQPVQQLLRAKFLLEDRGKIQVKGKGIMRTYYLVKPKALDKRYTAIFTLPKDPEKLYKLDYIPQVDLSEIHVNENPAQSIEIHQDTPTSSNRPRKGSIFSSVLPHKGSSSSVGVSGGKNLTNQIHQMMAIEKGTESLGRSTMKKNQITFLKAAASAETSNNSPSRSRASSLGDDDIAQLEDVDGIDLTHIGKGVSGPNVIHQPNTLNLAKVEEDLRKHYTLDKIALQFKSRDNIVEMEFLKDHNKVVFNKIVLSMIFASVIFALASISDYFTLKGSHDSVYDRITGIRFGLVFFQMLYIYTVSKSLRLRHYVQQLACFFFIIIFALLIVLISLPPLNEIPIDGLLVSEIMIITTISYNFSGIRFIYANVVMLFCIFFFNISLLWKETPQSIMLSHNFYLVASVFLNVSTSYLDELFLRQNWVHGKLLDKDRRETEQLVAEILPMYVVLKMKQGIQLIYDEFDQVTIFLSDIVGFTEMAARLGEVKLVETLNEIYSTFDEIAQKHGVLKVATIGDAYLCVCGCPEKREDHAERVVAMAIDMLEAIKSIKTADGIPVRMRIGIHSGPVVTGVTGIKMIHYQLWGESVQITQQMESMGVADRIHLSEATASLLHHKYIFEDRGDSNIKKRKMKTYFLLRDRMPSDPPPPPPSSTHLDHATHTSLGGNTVGATFSFAPRNDGVDEEEEEDSKILTITGDDEDDNPQEDDEVQSSHSTYNNISSDSLYTPPSTTTTTPSSTRPTITFNIPKGNH